MKVSEGRLGRVFIITLDREDVFPEAVEKFAAERGIAVAQVLLNCGKTVAGIIAPGEDETPAFHPGEIVAKCGEGFEIVVQEILGVRFRRHIDVATGKPVLTQIRESVTRVMEKPAPEPNEPGPGTVPVYLFNAEFN